MNDQMSSAGISTTATDDFLEQLRAHQQRSHAPDRKELSAWKAELERAALSAEALGKTFMSKAAESREKIRAIDVLLGKDRDPMPDGSPAVTSSPASSQTARLVREFNPDAPPDLRHTSVLTARLLAKRLLVGTSWFTWRTRKRCPDLGRWMRCVPSPSRTS